MSKVKQWVYDLKTLPNDKRGLASGVCSSGALALALIVYLIAEALVYKLGVSWHIGSAAIAEGDSNDCVFHQTKSAQNLKVREKRSGS